MEKNININVVVIGGGPAGYSAAFRCADLGVSVLIIEKFGILGGTCLNVGCIPSKSLLYVTTLIREIEEFSKYKIFLGDIKKLDIVQVMNWKNKIISNLRNGLNNMAKLRKVDIIPGIAKFLNKNAIEVVNNNDIYHIKFSHAIIATGSKPAQLSGISDTDPRIFDSTQALNFTHIPKKFLIIGAGIIGLEMATIYSALGAQVDIIDSSEKFFPAVDDDVSNFFLQCTKNYFNVYSNTPLLHLKPENHGILAKIKKNNNIECNNLYDNVLISIGRIPYINNLNLNHIGIQLNKTGFIEVNNQMCTNIPNIFAVGDVVGQPMLAHKGIHEAHIAAEVIAGKKHFFDPKIIPCVAYCDPEIAWTGMMEESAKLNGINYRSVIVPWQCLGKAISSNCSNSGMTKLIVDKDCNRLIGGVIVGRHAGELLSQISLSIEMGCDIEDLALTIHAHPTLSESINIAAQLFNGTATDLMNKI